MRNFLKDVSLFSLPSIQTRDHGLKWKIFLPGPKMNGSRRGFLSGSLQSLFTRYTILRVLVAASNRFRVAMDGTISALYLLSQKKKASSSGRVELLASGRLP